MAHSLNVDARRGEQYRNRAKRVAVPDIHNARATGTRVMHPLLMRLRSIALSLSGNRILHGLQKLDWVIHSSRVD
jgi:hypothetical protein